MPSMPHRQKHLETLYQYHDVRLFLRDLFAERKKQSSSLSIRAFAAKARIKSHSFLSAVMLGKRNLTPATTEKLIVGLGLNTRQSEYFRALVAYTQCRSHKEKDFYFQNLIRLRKHTDYHHLLVGQYSYFENWKNFVIRELAPLLKSESDFRKLGKLLIPPMSLEESRKSLQVLEKAGLLEKTADGLWKQSRERLTTRGVPTHLIHKIREQFLDLAKNASQNHPPNQRYLASTTLTLSESAYRTAISILDKAREEINMLASSDEKPWKVFHSQMHLFPLTTDLNSEGME